MNSSSTHFDVLVVGAGPAGIAAACCAAESGARVGLVDNNPRPGGQIWRGQSPQHAENPDARSWFERFSSRSIEFLPSTEVIDQPAANRLTVQRTHVSTNNIDSAVGTGEISFDNLILCTGARELFLPFPGWTLPNVIGAGGLQALVKCGLPVAGKKIIIAGSGPLLLAVAAYLREHGADIRLIAEQAPSRRLARFALSLLFERAKLAQAFTIKRQLSGIPYKTNCWPVRATDAQGKDGKLESVTLRHGSRTWQESCDYLACGFHLVPNTELAFLLGCELRAGFVRVDDSQRTSVAGVFCAGEPTSIGGVDLSIVEGQIAGYEAAGNASAAANLRPRKCRLDGFAALLRQTFAIRDELRLTADPETIICRCEDVVLGRLRRHSSWRAAKLQTRCGMGPCQGRICGPITEFLFGWKPDSVRPPIFAAPMQTLAFAVPQLQVQDHFISHEEPR